MSNFYCYLHMRPDKFGLDSVFYVGKGTEKRIKRVSRKHNNHHTRIVSKVGKENVRVISFPCISEDAAFELEKVLIKAFRDAGIQLCNCTDGGEGPSGCARSDATRAKMSAAKLGAHCTEETKAKLSAANQLVQRKAPIRKNNKSGHKGVDWESKSSRWRVRITIDRKEIWLGRFATLEEAVLARKQGELKYWK